MHLVETIDVSASAEICVDLMRSVDVHVLTSREIGGRAVAGRTAGLSSLGDETTWSARFFGIRLQVRTRISAFHPPHRITDARISGLPRTFQHEYRFETLSNGSCQIVDAFAFASPMGFLGALLDRALLERPLRAQMRSRLAQIKSLAEKPGAAIG